MQLKPIGTISHELATFSDDFKGFKSVSLNTFHQDKLSNPGLNSILASCGVFGRIITRQCFLHSFELNHHIARSPGALQDLHSPAAHQKTTPMTLKSWPSRI